MAYQLTSASGWRDLLSVIKTFALANGWTSVYDQIAAKGQLGLSKGNCFCALGATRNSGNTADANTFNRSDLVNGGTVPDAEIRMALGTSLTAGNTKYWNHPGSLATTETDNDTVIVNDLVGPFANVWLFSPADGNAIHVVVQSSAERYTSFGFGQLDVKGLNQPRCGYCVGSDHTWWPDNADWTQNSSSDFNYVRGSHRWGWWGQAIAQNTMIPAGLLNLAYTWGVAPPVCLGLSSPTISQQITPGDRPNDFRTSSRATGMLDQFLAFNNQATTGGVVLHPFPWIYENGTSDTGIAAWLGEIPEARMVNMTGINPGQEIKYASDIWVAFPWKQKGIFDNSNFGPNALPICNTQEYGIAFRKIV